jgi:hypothetical protein
MQAMEADEDRIAAYHKAGHAVVARAQGIRVDYVTIEHEEEERGRIALEQEPGLLASIAGMERLIRVSRAVPMAQQRACGDDENRSGARWRRHESPAAILIAFHKSALGCGPRP